VAAHCALPATVPAFSILTAMKSSTTLTTAALLALLAVPAAWQWQKITQLRSSVADAKAQMARHDGSPKAPPASCWVPVPVFTRTTPVITSGAYRRLALSRCISGSSCTIRI
jgi:hypothetical protein